MDISDDIQCALDESIQSRAGGMVVAIIDLLGDTTFEDTVR
jgi:hypothetical protein